MSSRVPDEYTNHPDGLREGVMNDPTGTQAGVYMDPDQNINPKHIADIKRQAHKNKKDTKQS